MITKPYDLIVYIGRFQPFHDAHEKTIIEASNIAKTVLVLVGSKNSPRTTKNPFTYDERVRMIKDTVDNRVHDIRVDGIPDYKYDDSAWIRKVGETVDSVAEDVGAAKIAVIGHDKDSSSFYLNYFPQWEFRPMPAFPMKGETIDATKIRKLMFTQDFAFIKGVVSKKTNEFITDFTLTEEYRMLLREWKYIEDYKKAWSVAPYPPTFNTVDAVVVQSGHILLVKRGGFPGYGQWATPGGFLDPSERIEDAVIRELREETRLKVPEKVLKGSIVTKEVFDDPSRSLRGRTITHAFLIHLDDSEKLPKVKGSDDAIEAVWFSFAEFAKMQEVMYEDHWFIVNHLLNNI